MCDVISWFLPKIEFAFSQLKICVNLCGRYVEGFGWLFFHPVIISSRWVAGRLLLRFSADAHTAGLHALHGPSNWSHRLSLPGRLSLLGVIFLSTKTTR
jgi:hypothetical protein